MLKDIINLLKYEFTIELRQAHALGGLLLYVLSTLFIIFISFANVSGPIWIILYWIIVLFASVNAILKSFTHEMGKRRLYYFSLVNGSALYISKVVYNFIILFILSIINFTIFGAISGSPILNLPLFLLAILLGSLGLSMGLTLIAGIASQSSNNGTMMTILGFPIIIPILISLIHMSAYSLQVGTIASVGAEAYGDIMSLLGIILLLFAVSIILFPFLWKN